MQKDQRQVLLALLAISAIVFWMFIPANQTGAQDANMLALFEVDEYAQYPHLVRMLTPGETLLQTLRNFLVYQHYFYGYPFYFFSALLALPVKLALGSGWAGQTHILVTALRQLVNVLPMMAALLLLVWMHTRFRPLWKAAGLYLLLLSVPGVVANNLWWHPDSLVFLFVVLTLFFLDRDDLRFGRNFFLAAAACGLAAGTKYLGLLFVLAVPLYLAWGLRAGRLRIGRAALLGAGFVAVMAAAFVLANPLLLLPQERAEIVAVQRLQFVQTGTGVFLANDAPLLAEGYPEDLRIHYGELYFVLLGFAALAMGLFNPERRRLNALTLAWLIPITVVVLTAGTRRTHYFLPVLLPVYAAFANFFPTLGGLTARLSGGLRRAIPAALMLGLVVQVGLFARTDLQLLRAQLSREATSASLHFTQQVRAYVLAGLPVPPEVVYRDWRVYFPSQSGQQVEMNWELASYPLMEALRPQLVLLERENVALFSQAFVMDRAVDRGNMAATHAFYGDAARETLKGYRLVYTDDFGMAFVSDALAQYFRWR